MNYEEYDTPDLQFAFMEGFEAFTKFRGTKEHIINPYNPATDRLKFKAWNRGYGIAKLM